MMMNQPGRESGKNPMEQARRRRRGGGPGNKPGGPRPDQAPPTGNPNGHGPRGNRPRPKRDGNFRVREFRDPGPPASQGPLSEASGILDMNPQGWGVLRSSPTWADDPQDAFVPTEVVRRYGLRSGQQLVARTRPANGGPRRAGVAEVLSVEGHEAEAA